MSKIKYIDKDGEHTGTLTTSEYVHYGVDERCPVDYPVYMQWNWAEYANFKQAVNKKYNTKVEKAWLV